MFNDRKNKNNEDDQQLNSIAHNINVFNQSTVVSTETIANIEASGDYNIQSDNPRATYADSRAMEQAKADAFQSGKPVKDLYTGEKLTQSQTEAVDKYGEDWSRHAAESDHKVSVDEAYQKHKDDIWTKRKQLKDRINDKDNFQQISKHNNASKGSLSEEEFIKKKYEKGEISAKKRDQLLDEAKSHREQFENDIFWDKVGNIAGTFNDAGIKGAQSSASSAATLSAVTNMIDIFQGKKNPKEACMEVAKTAAVSGAKGYVQTGALAVINRTLGNSKYEILKCLGESNAVGKVITAFQVVGDTFIKLLNHEIDLGEATERVVKQASQAVIISEAGAIGQLMIPIPYVGFAVGSLVGMFVCKGMMDFFETLEKRKQHIEELQEMQRQYDQVTQFFHKYRLEYQNFAQKFNLEKKEFFTEQLLNIDDGLLYENYELVTNATNNITTALGGEVLYDNLDDFCDFLDS